MEWLHKVFFLLKNFFLSLSLHLHIGATDEKKQDLNREEKENLHPDSRDLKE